MPKTTLSQDAKEDLTLLETEELVIRAQADDMAAMEALVKRYQRLVYVSLYQLAPERNDIADLAQDVLLRMCRSIKTLRNPKTFKFWLNRIVTNLYYDQLRKSTRQLNTISMDALLDDKDDGGNGGTSRSADIPDTAAMPEHLALNSELDKQIYQAIIALPEQFRTMIVLREIQKLSYEEIADLTHTTLGTVKSRLARARLKLQEALKPYLDDLAP